jgi:DNA-binding NarL/FixJ family response regulator
LLATGATNREISRQLHLSEGTVKNHVSSILAALGLRDRTQAALAARERGWA